MLIICALLPTSPLSPYCSFSCQHFVGSLKRHREGTQNQQLNSSEHTNVHTLHNNIIHTYRHMCMHTNAHTTPFMHACTHTHTCRQTHTCMHARAHTHTYGLGWRGVDTAVKDSLEIIIKQVSLGSGFKR